MLHEPQATLLDMVQAIERVERLAGAMQETDFLDDERSQWAVYSQIVILGEAANRIDDEFQAAHPEIPWSQVIGMRHRLVHGYDSVDWVRVLRTVTADLPQLLKRLKALVPQEGTQ